MTMTHAVLTPFLIFALGFVVGWALGRVLRGRGKPDLAAFDKEMAELERAITLKVQAEQPQPPVRRTMWDK